MRPGYLTPELRAELNRKYRLRAKYGMSLEEYDALFAEQLERCAICREKQQYKRLAVDHDHLTGEIRGLLCENCNAGLGRFMDDRLLLARAAEYLLIHR